MRLACEFSRAQVSRSAHHICKCQLAKVAVFRGNFFRVWEYGHILHDLLPGLVWLSAAQPHAKLIIERTIKLPEFLEWFDSELYARALFLPSNQARPPVHWHAELESSGAVL